MAIRGDSYGTVDEVTAVTRHLLAGEEEFNTDTRPTKTEVEKFIDRASSYLNTAFKGIGLTTPIVNSTAKLLCDDWVVYRSSMYVELTQRGVGWTDDDGSRIAAFRGISGDAMEFAKWLREGFTELGVGVTTASSEGLQFTAINKHSQRSDPDSTTREQPVFRRHKWDND